jgi:peptidylprolyl isomerase
LATSQGDLVVDLNAESAPVNVNSFVFLAGESWYDGSNFFFVQDNFVAVTGDPTNSTVGYPGYYCTGETDSTFESAGVVGMLPNGQFFVTLGADAAQLNGQFARIGEVVEGAEILEDLARVTVGDPTAPEPSVLESVTIEPQ